MLGESGINSRTQGYIKTRTSFIIKKNCVDSSILISPQMIVTTFIIFKITHNDKNHYRFQDPFEMRIFTNSIVTTYFQGSTGIPWRYCWFSSTHNEASILIKQVAIFWLVGVWLSIC